MQKTLTPINLGDINLNKNIMISDPCYPIGTWCQIQLNNIKPGIYEAFCIKSNEDEWGIRSSSLIIKHKDIHMVEYDELNIHTGDIGVDSGQAGIFDISIYPSDNHNKIYRENFYNECCDLTLSDNSCGALLNKKGIVSSSGYGDGSYTLYYNENENNEIDYLHILFIGPDIDYTNNDYELIYSEDLESYFSTIHGLIFN